MKKKHFANGNCYQGLPFAVLQRNPSLSVPCDFMKPVCLAPFMSLTGYPNSLPASKNSFTIGEWYRNSSTVWYPPAKRSLINTDNC